LPELWSGIVKDKIPFVPGANSSTVMVVIILDFVSTFTSAVMFLFLNDVVTSPKKASLCFTALEVKAYRTTPEKCHPSRTVRRDGKKPNVGKFT
jgi:hypothetical protein